MRKCAWFSLSLSLSLSLSDQKMLSSAELSKNSLPRATVLEVPKVSTGESEGVNMCTYASDCTSQCARKHGGMRM